MPTGIYERSKNTLLRISLINRKCPIKRFWKFVKIGINKNDCWKWIGGKIWGYGQFRVYDKVFRANRFSYILHFGAIPKDLNVLHKCNNRECCNPLHLYLGTYQDNANDKVKANRQYKGIDLWSSKLKPKDIFEIRSKYIPYKYSTRKLAKEYNVNHKTIVAIVNNRTWKSL